MTHELIVAVRSLRRARGYTAAAIVSLALAIGVTTAVFALADAVLFRPPSGISQPGELAAVYHQDANHPDRMSSVSWMDYEYYGQRTRSFTGLAAYLRVPIPIEGTDGRTNVSGELVSSNYFEVLGVGAQLGQMISSAVVGEPVVVISDRFWRERFGSRSDALNASVSIAGNAFRIVGVAPAQFRGVVMDWGEPPDLWVPVDWYREASPALREAPLRTAWGMHAFLVTGRLREGVTVAQAKVEMAALAAQASVEHPERVQRDFIWSTRVFPLAEARFWPGFRNQIVRVITVLMAVAAGVLLIACANIAALMLTRASERRRELAVRAAIGAGVARIGKLLMTEALLLGLAGTAAGIAVAEVCVRMLSSFPALFAIPLALDLHIEARVLAFTAATGIVCSLLFGIAPARNALRFDLVTPLRASGRMVETRHRRIDLRGVLISAEVAAAVVLLAGAGLFLRTFRNAMQSDPFLRAGNLLLVDLDWVSRIDSNARTEIAQARFLDSVRLLPGVRSAALGSNIPMSRARSAADVLIDGKNPNVELNVVSSGYFTTVGSGVERGRDFTGADRGCPARGCRQPSVCVSVLRR